MNFCVTLATILLPVAVYLRCQAAVGALKIRFSVVLHILISKIAEVCDSQCHIAILCKQHLNAKIINLLREPNHTGIFQLPEHTALTLD